MGSRAGLVRSRNLNECELSDPRFPRGTGTNGLLVRSGRPAPMVARVPDPPHDPEIPPRDRHQWSPRHESPCVHPRVRFATTLGPVAVIGPWLGLARSFLEFLVVSWSDLLSLSSSPDRRSWDSPPARGSASGQSRNFGRHFSPLLTTAGPLFKFIFCKMFRTCRHYRHFVATLLPLIATCSQL